MDLTKEEANAIFNLRGDINTLVSFPERVLRPEYVNIYVMDFGRLFLSQTVDLLKTLIRWERSDVVVLGKLKEIGRDDPDLENDLFFVNCETEAEAYQVFLRRNIDEFLQRRETAAMKAPWLVFTERIGACSDRGSWCIYGEKFAEIAVMGFKQPPDTRLEKMLGSDFGVERLADALRRDSFFDGRDDDYSRRQREKLSAAYL